MSRRKKLSPIEALREGITTNNWGYVCDAYKQLTGEILKAPKDSGSNDEVDKLKEILSRLCQFTDSIKYEMGIDPASGESVSAETIAEIMDEGDEDLEESDEEEIVAETKKKKSKKAAEEDEEELAVDDRTVQEIDKYVNNTLLAGPKGGLVTGKVDAKQNQVVFVTDGIVNPDEQKRNKKIAKKTNKIRRGAYIPRIKQCANCQHKFDLNRFPSAVIMATAGEQRQLQCPKCRQAFEE
jgi:hypothetical protein